MITETTINVLTLEYLIRRAEREAPRSPEEKRALTDAREALDRARGNNFPVDPTQLELPLEHQHPTYTDEPHRIEA